jgi:oligoendopeptidase F
MEIIFSFFYNDLFGEDTGKVMRDDLLLNMIFSIVDGAMYDEFQQRVYSEPELTSEKVRSIFDEVYRSYGYSTYDGYENEWIGISHNFENPFYYISYAVSAVGALEIYQLCCEDMVAGVNKYLSVEALDSEVYYYSEAIDEAGLSDIFDISTYSDIADALSADFS